MKNRVTKCQEGKDMIFGIVIMALMVAVFIYSRTIESTSISGVVTSGFFPMMGAIIGFAMGLVLTIKNATKLVKLNKQGEEATTIEPMKKEQVLRILATFVLIALYLKGITFLGMPVASIIYLFVQMLLVSRKEHRTKKGIIIMAIVAIAMPLIVYFPFRYIFKIMLPLGIFR